MLLATTITAERGKEITKTANSFLDIKLTYEKFFFGSLSFTKEGRLTFLYPDGDVKIIRTLYELKKNSEN